ncbi:dynacortin [Heterostelium album PN500]|uniref:Dynacortin n=1 Tax=Heterostelium pallidum (strain ATCC 26659 / Pp 5 / PN500) TaxID=670386 RepID=D3BTW2_HETP5|nr:dynacortin [Heterostelium album PN500]EFA75148.1 dynacortin [Heterostelium album PN500]|eukprot:XP_020427282.1 dynacortin [Heterostelium album PN500]
MSSQDEIESREEQRLSRALQGKVGTNHKGRVTSWAPVVTKPTPTVPVNYSGTASGGGVDTQSPYANVAGLSISDEKMRQEQARLKKWGLDTGAVSPASSNEEQPSSSQSTPSLESAELDEQARVEERRLTKMGLSSNNLIEEYGAPTKTTTAPAAAPSKNDAPVDNASIATNIDGHTNEEKVRQEQKRLERWGLKINTGSTSPANSTSPAASISPKSNNSSNSTATPAAPSNPLNTQAANAVAKQYGLTADQVQPFLDQLIFAAKAVKLILHKKSSNHDVTITTLMDIVRESANFALTLPSDLPIGFDISQSAGRLAGAVNELVKGGDNREPAQTIKLYEEIQTILGVLYLGVVAN